ncbi:ABC transporter ATP-binding protein [Litoricolaceae bacterium]|nr:ABC transporter ATP-binding protein [Litorivicinaceae bacterium]MDB2425639.1 ABC transporter ATP-binding protein [Litorivicinaceae bacterium]
MLIKHCRTEKYMILQLEHVTKNFRDQGDVIPVLTDINFSISAGETIALIGDSGSGKSTLLHIAAGLDIPDTGRVLIHGQDISRLRESDRARVRRTDVSVIFQQFNLIPSITIEANIRFQAALSQRKDDVWIDELVKVLGLNAHLRKYPEMLSGGQQQRVAIARSLAVRPALLLADEPTGNLDEQTSDTVVSQMLALVAEINTSLLIVTHSPHIAAQMKIQKRLQNGCLI